MTAISHRYGWTYAVLDFRPWKDGIATHKQTTYDGDTVHVRVDDALGIRFLGIDTPEKKIPLPGAPDIFVGLDKPQWDAFLSDPFQPNGPLNPANYSAGLKNYIDSLTGAGQGAIHKLHADAAEDHLEGLIKADMETLNKTKEDFEFFLRFSFEVMDSYGRFLCYINRNQPDHNDPEPRPPSLNERMLTAGMAFPYFIWPNINPWRSQGSVVNSVLMPGTANTVAQVDPALNAARQAVQNARANHVGIFSATNPMTFEPFEIRYLGRGGVPSRWVIDLSKIDNILIHPENYWTVSNPEDRLFIPVEYVPLFVESGWQRQPAP